MLNSYRIDDYDDDEKFDTFSTKDVHAKFIMDSDGNIITYDCWMKGGNVELKVYKDGKVADSYTLVKPDDGFVSLTANGGTAAVCTMVQPEGVDMSYHAFTPGYLVEYKEPFPINVTIIKYSE